MPDALELEAVNIHYRPAAEVDQRVVERKPHNQLIRFRGEIVLATTLEWPADVNVAQQHAMPGVSGVLLVAAIDAQPHRDNNTSDNGPDRRPRDSRSTKSPRQFGCHFISACYR